MLVQAEVVAVAVAGVESGCSNGSGDYGRGCAGGGLKCRDSMTAVPFRRCLYRRAFAVQRVLEAALGPPRPQTT